MPQLVQRVLAITGLALLAACGGSGGKTDNQIIGIVPVEAPVATLPANASASEKIDAFVQAQMAALHTPGVVVVVAEEGRISFSKAYGSANLSPSVPLRVDHRVEIGSISKSFVATALMMLVEEGKIALDDPLSRYLPGLPATWSGVTIRRTLSHTAGLPDYPDDAFFSTLEAHGPYSEAQMLERMASYSLSFAPGSSYLYSNIGFDLLGMVVGKVSGKPYATFLQERIFTPLEMSSARVMAVGDSMAANATGYALSGGRLYADLLTPAMRTYLALGASGVEMNALDLVKFDTALYSEKLLKKATLELMWTNVGFVQAATATTPDIYYGLGWQLRKQNGHRWVYHSGGMPGYVTDFMRYPDDKFTVIVLTTLGDDSGGDSRTTARFVAQTLRPGL